MQIPIPPVVALLGAVALAVLWKKLYRLYETYFLAKSQDSKGWPLEAWLAKVREDAIDPDMEIIDPHHCLWDPTRHPKGEAIPLMMMRIAYISTTPEELNRIFLEGKQKDDPALVTSYAGRSKRQVPMAQPYMGSEFEFDIRNCDSGKRGHNVVQTVYVENGWKDRKIEECLRPMGEVRMVEQVHRAFPRRCNAVVAEANLLLPDVERTLKALKERPLVRGVRHSLAYTKNPDISGANMHTAKEGTAKDPAFREGFKLLEKYGFSFDVWMFHEQLEDITDLAKAFPKTTIVIDHVAQPLGILDYTHEGVFPEWEKGIRELAKASENVYVKLSGLGMCHAGFHFDDREAPPSSQELAEAWGPYFKVVLEAFGTTRCMFASNFPLDRVSTDYTVLWNAFKLIVKDYSETEKKALFHGNAKRVYRL